MCVRVITRNGYIDTHVKISNKFYSNFHRLFTHFFSREVYMAEPEILLCVVSIDEVDLFVLCAYYVKEKDILKLTKKNTLHSRATAI